MKRFFLFFLFLIGNTYAFDMTNSPKWEVKIIHPHETYNHVCKGVIVARRWIVTAAHCKQSLALANTTNSFYIQDRSGVDRLVPMKNFIRHPDYVQTSHLNDIALIKLDSLFDFVKNKEIDFAVLPANIKVKEYSHFLTTSLFNRESNNPYNTLASITSISQYKSESVLRAYTNKNPCFGDSGAGLVDNYKFKKHILLGIMIAADPKCRKTDSKFYTRVYDFIPWMRETSQKH